LFINFTIFPLFDLEKLVRPHLLTLKPYSSARDEYTGHEGVFLDANENPFGSVTQVAYNRYPDPYQRQLKAKLGQLKGARPGQIFLGNGSDEAIDLLYRAFAEPLADNVVLCPPTYGMYEVSADINRVEVRKVPLTADFQLQPAQVLAACDAHTKLIWLCSPNNPSGNDLRPADVLEVVRHAPGLVVVDEAYIDFADRPSYISYLDQYPNLVVLQTFSKAWGLAALRLGMMFASEGVVRLVNKIKPPYNINEYTQAHALEGLAQVARKEQMVADILAARDHLAQALAALPLVEQVHPSDANFLLVRVQHARQVYEQLVEGKTIVRDRSKVALCDNCLRITVGTPAENRQLLAQLATLGSRP
jgi:histidinol-phosphate aminotransferase